LTKSTELQDKSSKDKVPFQQRFDASSSLLDEEIEASSVQLRELRELDNVDPTFTRFRLRNVRLRTAKSLRYIDLRQTFFPSSPSKPLQDA